MNRFLKMFICLLVCLFITDAVMEMSKIQRHSGNSTPNFTVSVYPPARSLSVTIVTEVAVRVRLCYQHPAGICSQLSPPVLKQVNTSSPTVNLTFPFLLPCLCVQVYYPIKDAVRTPVCPFENHVLDGPDIWHSSAVITFGTSLHWTSLCPLKPTASLCWQNLKLSTGCIHIHNSTLYGALNRQNPLQTIFNVSHVDKHPNVCVKLSVNSSSQVYCPFKPGLSEWQIEVIPVSLHMHVYLTSAVPGSFSAQLCILEEWDCMSSGVVHSISMEGGESKKKLILPFDYVQAELCVQVWRTDPVQYGWRLVCPVCSHKRWGLVVMATVLLAVLGLGLAHWSYHAVQRISDLKLSHRTVLLVCSSEQTEQLSVMCALASILQGELSVEVHMAHLALGSVARLGPLPWLYAQCEAVRAAGGRVLVVWSPEGSQAYQRWWGSAVEMKPKGVLEKEMHSEEKERWKREDCKKENDACGHMEESERVENDGSWWKMKADGDMEPCAVTIPVLRAALAYLQGVLQRQEHGFALVCLQGLCSSQDIPYELQELPCYCLPRDFMSLVQDLHDCPVGTRWQCCHRLASVVQAYRMAVRLAHKLQPWLPSAGDKEKKEKELTYLHRDILST